jgi:hypothetical protein
MASGLGRTIPFYDGENRPLKVVKDGVTLWYDYSPDGERLRKRVDTPITGGVKQEKWVYFGDAALDPQGRWIKHPHPDVRITGDAKCFVHRDHLASVRAETRGADVPG